MEEIIPLREFSSTSIHGNDDDVDVDDDEELQESTTLGSSSEPKIPKPDNTAVSVADEEPTPTNNLHEAYKNKGFKEVERLLKGKVMDINERDELGKTVLHHAAGKGKVMDINERDELGKTVLHHAAVSQEEVDIKAMLDLGAYIDTADDDGESPLDIIDFQVLETYLNTKVTANGKPADKDFTITLDYTKLLREKDGYYGFPVEVLQKIKHSHRPEFKDLLTHPILSSIIYLKWQGLKHMFRFAFLIHGLFLLFFTLYITFDIHEAYWFCWLPLLSLCFFEGLHIAGDLPKMIKSMDCILRLLTILSCLALLVSDFPSLEYPEKHEVSTHLKGISILFVWIELFFIIGKFESAIFFVTIFRKSFDLLVRFTGLHLPLLIGFTLSFNVLFREVNVKKKVNPFTDVLSSSFKTLIMFTGEYDASDTIPFSEIPITSHFIFLCFLGTICIVLFNLLIGLASTKTRNVEKNTLRSQCKAQIWQIYRYEKIFLSTNVGKYIFSPICTNMHKFQNLWNVCKVSIGQLMNRISAKRSNNSNKKSNKKSRPIRNYVRLENKKEGRIIIKPNDMANSTIFKFQYEKDKGFYVCKGTTEDRATAEFSDGDDTLSKEIVTKAKKIVKDRMSQEKKRSSMKVQDTKRSLHQEKKETPMSTIKEESQQSRQLALITTDSKDRTDETMGAVQIHEHKEDGELPGTSGNTPIPLPITCQQDGINSYLQEQLQDDVVALRVQVEDIKEMLVTISTKLRKLTGE